MHRRALVLATLVLAWPAAGRPLGATPLRPVLDLEGPGLTLTVAGSGMLAGRSRGFRVAVHGTVERALLYWAGRDRPCPRDADGGCVLPDPDAATPYRDQVLRLDGQPVVGELVGAEVQPDTNAGPVANLAWRADVTDAVRAKGEGLLRFRVGDADPARNLADLDGVGLLVVASDPAVAERSRVQVFDGLDFLYGEDRTPGGTTVAVPVLFAHGAAQATARRGELALLVGDARADAPERVEISGNPAVANALDGSAGPGWDADLLPVDVAPGVGSTAVRIVSEPVGANPDSLLWVAAALWLPSPVPQGCDAAFWAAEKRKSWIDLGVPPSARTVDTFHETTGYGALPTATLATAMRLVDRGGLLGAAKALVREGTAALLDAASPRVEYPRTRTQVVTAVDEALRSRDEAAIRALAADLAAANTAGCPIE